MHTITPTFDPVQEARRIVDAATARGITLRILGAVGFRIHCTTSVGMHASTGREISDIDLVGCKKQGTEICKLMSELGYLLDKTMLIHEGRYFFTDTQRKLKADVFLDRLEMCHTIDFSGRLDHDYPTIPLDELLLEKLQIVNIEQKDVIDVAMLLSDHDVGSSQKETIDKDHISKLLGEDWGFYYTVTANLSKISEAIRTMSAIQPSGKDRILGNIKLIQEEIEASPKSLAWKLRARVGPKTKWYRDVSNPRGAY